MPKSKAKSLILHAKRRASERYGLALSNDDLDKIVRLIQNHGAKFIRRQSGMITLWEVSFMEKKLQVVYDKQRSQVVTFLPPE